jgi:hypothetical protein
MPLQPQLKTTTILLVLMACAISVSCVMDILSAELPDPSSKSNRPNGQTDLPSLHATNIAQVEVWLEGAGYPWSKQEIVVQGKRKLACFDFVPYYGQPARHLFVYQVLDKQVSMVFCSVIRRPPKIGKPISFGYNGASDSLLVSIEREVCLTISLKTLWCD